VKTGESCQKNDAFKLVRALDPKLWFWEAAKLREKTAQELENLKSKNSLTILTALAITSRESREFFATKPHFYKGMKNMQTYIRNWEPYRELRESSEYKELNSIMEPTTGNQQAQDDATIRTLVEKTERLAGELRIKVSNPPHNDPKARAEALLSTVIKGGNVNVNRIKDAAEDIYLPPFQRTEHHDVENLDQDIEMQDKDTTQMSEGYYFAIIDKLALGKALGETFQHLCEAMKKVEKAKDLNTKIATDATESIPYLCQHCNQKPEGYKTSGWLMRHINSKHPITAQEIGNAYRNQNSKATEPRGMKRKNLSEEAPAQDIYMTDV
jgi:hypothetical protein